MNDYKELIDELRAQCLCITYGDNCNNCEGLISEKAYCRLQIELHKKAADAIEQLVKERDAAIADLKEINLCSYCNNQNEHIIGTNTETGEQEDLGECGHGRGLFHQLCLSGKYSRCDRWEWRGVCE